MTFIKGLLGRLFAAPVAVVEPATPRDAERLSQLHGAAFHRGWGRAEFEQMLLERTTLVHRLRCGRAVEGFIVSRIAADEAEILSIAVDKRRRGRGLARDLLRTHLGHLAGRGVRTVFLEVEEANVPARALYRRAGFRDVGRRESYYARPDGSRANAVVMRRDLS